MPDFVITFARADASQDHHQLDAFWERASPYFVLHAAGYPDVRARMIGISDHGSDLEAWGANMSALELAKLVPGVPYTIEPLNTGDYMWRVADGVTLVEPR